jgi:D-alanine--poly(phosphoribitol) ligase subunit 2
MNITAEQIQAAIKQKIMALAEPMGGDASDLDADEVIPATGLIDSAALLDLIAWFEQTYSLQIPADELTIDNLGTIRSMASYLLRRKGLA